MKKLKTLLHDLFWISLGYFVVIGIPVILMMYYSDEKTEIENYDYSILKKKTEKAIFKKTEIENPFVYEDALLKQESEKVILLSIIKNIQLDTLSFVLREYIKENLEIKETSNDTYQKLINRISIKYKISKPKIASIIFSYKYEMLTKDEIEESAIETFKNDNDE